MLIFSIVHSYTTANCIDSTAAPENVFAKEVEKMRAERFKPLEQLTLEPFERGKCHCLSITTCSRLITDKDHAMVVARYLRS